MFSVTRNNFRLGGTVPIVKLYRLFEFLAPGLYGSVAERNLIFSTKLKTISTLSDMDDKLF